MEKTKKYTTFKDFFKNIVLALKRVFIVDNDVLDAEYVELTGDLAKDPIEALQKHSDKTLKSKEPKEPSKSRTRAKEPSKATSKKSTIAKTPKSKEPEER